MSAIYMVKALNKVTGRTEVRWGGSMAEVREHKAALVESCGCKPKEVTHSEKEIAFSKAGVLEFLNAEATVAP